MKHILAACPNTVSNCNLHAAEHGWTAGGAIFGLVIVALIVVAAVMLKRHFFPN